MLFYFPQFIPGFDADWVTISALCDALFMVGLFVAGELLWSKIEVIFRFDPDE